MSYRFLIIILFLILSFNVNFLAMAESESELHDRINNNNLEIQKLEQEIKDFNQKILSKQSDAKTLKSAILELESKKAVIEKDIKVSNLKIENLKQNIKETESQIQDTSKKLDSLGLGLSQTFRQLNYVSKIKNNFAFNILSGKNLDEFFERFNNNFEMRKSLSGSVNFYNKTKSALDDTNQNYKKQEKSLNDLKDNLEDKKVLIKENQEEKDQLLKETKAEESNYQKLLSDRKKKKQDLEKEVSDYENKLKAFTNVSSLPKFGSSVLSYPVSKVNITQYFGNTPFASQNPQVYNGSGHNGIDFAVSIGTQVYAAADGVVAGVGNTDEACSGASYGKWVLIKHNNGLSSLYAHLFSFTVSAGQSVSQGQKLGLSGNTGYSTGPHLHFTVYASEAVHIAGPTEYRSKACGTYLIMPLSAKTGYLNPLTYFAN